MTDEDEQALLDYMDKFGRIPAGVFKTATLPGVNKFAAMAEAARAALESGQPVQDWWAIVLPWERPLV